MKHFFLILSLLFAGVVSAQEKNSETQEKDPHLKDVVNTLKERILLQGYVQTGYTYNELDDSNSFDFKRAILMVSGQITNRWKMYFMCNFGKNTEVLEAYTEYRFLPELTLRVGEFKTMYTMENPLSTTVTELVDVYSQAVGYLAAGLGDPLQGPHAGRDLGLMIYGDLFNNFATYHLGLMNGQGINVKDGNHQKDLVGCLVLNPTSWLAVGGSFIKGKGHAVGTSIYNPTVQAGDDYTRNRYALSAWLKTKAVDVRTEYLAGKDDEVESEGYYATLTGRILPKLDVIASYDYFNKNKEIGARQTNYVIGLQYWFYPRCRICAQLTRCTPYDTEDYNLFQAQFQVRF